MPVTTEALLAAHGPALRSFLGARCRDADLTADLMQETAIRLVSAESRLSADGNARGYLFRVAANVWRDYLRREMARRRVAVQVALDAPAAAPAADADVLAHDLRLAVRRVIEGLPAAQRAVVELRQREDITFREIAERLGRPLGTVLGQMRAALETISAALEEYR